MPRTKKSTKTENTVTTAEFKDTLITCKSYTQDQVRNAIAELQKREELTEDTARRLSSLLETVVSDSFSKVIASTGF